MFTRCFPFFLDWLGNIQPEIELPTELSAILLPNTVGRILNSRSTPLYLLLCSPGTMDNQGREFNANRTGLILILGITFGAVIGYLVADIPTWIGIGLLFGIVAAVILNRGMIR